jgi:hypothetical protein
MFPLVATLNPSDNAVPSSDDDWFEVFVLVAAIVTAVVQLSLAI